MTKLPVLSALAFLIAANAIAQEAPVQESPAQVAPAPAMPAGETPGEPLPLIPEAPETTAKPRAVPAPAKKKSSTEQAADDLQTRLRYRAAKTKALQDPKFQQEWDRAHAIKTEPERRAAMKSYYNMLCDRMERIDPMVKGRVEGLRRSLAWRFDASAVRSGKAKKPAEEEEGDLSDQ